MKTIILLCYVLTLNLAWAEQTSTPFVVNPDSIRTQLLSQNISLLQTLNNVESSKLNVNMARAKLFPSINLGVLLPALSNPTFLLASVTYLFPFLVPANWAVLKQEKNLFESDKASYKALQLNLLGNAYSLFYTHINDLAVQKIYSEQVIVLEKLYQSLKHESEVLGDVPAEELDLAAAQMNDAKVKVSRLQELLINEKASLRTLLALPIGTELTIENRDIAPSSFEEKTLLEIFDRSMSMAPEVIQLNYLIKAAENGKFAKMMGFVSQASISGTATSSTNVFGNLRSGGLFSFGLDNIITVQFANNNIDSIKLRQEQLKEENQKTTEILTGQLIEMKLQLGYGQDELRSRLAIYNGQKIEYKLGLISLQDLLLTESQLTNTKVNLVKSELDFNLQRLAFLRLVVDGDFSKVQGCNAKSVGLETKKSLHIPGFGKKKAQSLDEVCRQ